MLREHFADITDRSQLNLGAGQSHGLSECCACWYAFLPRMNPTPQKWRFKWNRDVSFTIL